MRITIYWISLETIVNSIKILSGTSLPRIVDHKKLFLCVGFAVPRAVVSLLLDDVVPDGECIQSPATQILTGFSFNKEMSRSAKNHFLIQIKKIFWALPLLELFHTTRRTLHCPCHESSSLSNFCWKGCRCSSVASGLKSLSMRETRSSPLFLEHENFLLVSQLLVALQTLWNQCLFHRDVSTNWWIVHSSQVSRVEMICVYVFVCVFVFIQTFNRQWHN